MATQARQRLIGQTCGVLFTVVLIPAGDAAGITPRSPCTTCQQHVFLTHFHAELLAGHIELGNEIPNRTGTKIHLGQRA